MIIKNRSVNRTPAAVLFLSAFLIVTLLAGCARGSTAGDASEGGLSETDAPNSEAAEKTTVVTGVDITVTSWVSEKRPDKNVSNETDLSSIDVGPAETGDARLGLVRFDLPAGVTPRELVSARLRMKMKEGDAPKVRAGTVTDSWSFALVDWNSLEGHTVFRDDAPICEADEGDWYGIDVTDIVREWVAGDRPNYGFVLAGTEEGKLTRFWSAFGDDEANYPQLSVRYREDAPAAKYGKYGYTEQPEEAGNCLSYALRDTDAIYEDALFGAGDADAFEKAFAAGTDGALAYFKDVMGNYIEAHKEALGIETWRTLSGFDDPIDPEKEYMIALKIGAQGMDSDAEMSAFSGVDYHLRVRLDDGRWAEKVPHVASRVTPGSNEAFDTGKYPWDSVFQWGYFKWTNYYDRPALYFAITKSTDEFTAHMH